MGIYESAEALVGRTPLVRLGRFAAARQLPAGILGKLELANPAGSVKDRVALEMLRQAERRGLLSPGGTVLAPTSGNTGIGLAAQGALRGYRVLVIMPETMSPERRKLIRAFGAELVLTPGSQGMAGAVEKARALSRTIPGAWIAQQFEDSAIQVVAVEPAASPMLSGGQAGPHGIQGIGANFVPDTLDLRVCDEIMQVTQEQAYQACRDLAQTEGLLVGISGGAALAAAAVLAERPENRGKALAVILPDGGERYLSTDLFEA